MASKFHQAASISSTGKTVLVSEPATPNKQNSSTLKSFISGSITGTTTCLLFQPLDLVKTHLQRQTLVINNNVNTEAILLGKRNIFGIVSDIIYNDSYRGLWRGLTPSLYRTAPGIGMYFCTLNWMKTSFKPSSWKENMAVGFTARSLVCSAMLPITVIKIRYESGEFNYRNITQAFQCIWKAEGLRGIFSGWTATIARDAPYSGIYFMFYSQQKALLTSGIERPLDAKDHFRCGIIAGLLACVVTQPADVVKTQMQLYPTHYKNTLHCVLTILRRDGATGLGRGLFPRCLRKSLISALTWTLFEELMKRSFRFVQ